MSWLVNAAGFPQAVGYVNDFAEVISPATEAELEIRLENYTASSSNELAIVTLKSLGGDTVENTAVELFSQWGIGKKHQDNGVLLLLAVEERQLRLEVGYGLEPVLTDSRAGLIIREVITPELKTGNYDAGISAGTDAVIGVLSGSEVVPDAPAPAEISGTALIFIMIGFFAIFWLMRRRLKSSGLPVRHKSGWGGFTSGRSSGGFGGFSGGRSGGGGASGKW